jgi:hypothetical protein
MCLGVYAICGLGQKKGNKFLPSLIISMHRMECNFCTVRGNVQSVLQESHSHLEIIDGGIFHSIAGNKITKFSTGIFS